MPAALTFPGVYIEEVKSQVRTIIGVPTSITAFVGSAERGEVNEPIHITSWGEFERRFGGLSDDHLMSYMVFHYYQNGGSDAEIVRAVRLEDDGDKKKAEAATLDLGNDVKLMAASPGEWGQGLRAKIESVAGEADTYNLVVRDTGTGAEERFLNVKATAASPRALSKLLQGSSLVRAAEGSKDSNKPNKQGEVKADGGEDGSAVDNKVLKGAEASKSGLYALLKLDNRIFNLLCVAPPANEDVDFYDEAAKFCVDHRAVLLVDAPSGWNTIDEARKGAAKLDAIVSGDNARNAAIYFPRLSMPDENGNVESYPPGGAIAGVIARTDGQVGVWKAPAGTDASVSSVRDLSVRMNNLENGGLNPLGVNCIRNFPVIGTVVWGGRTMRGADQLADEWKYLPVRRTALFIEETLYRGTQWVVFQPNDEPLWSAIRLNVGAFMNSLWRQGAFQGGTPDQAYLVKCDSENNPQNDIDRGIVNILVGFAPLKPAEFVVIHIQQLAGQIQT